jgi:hypothetical protein
MTSSREETVRVRGSFALLGRFWVAMLRATAVMFVIRQMAVQPALRRGRPKRAAGRHAGPGRSRMRRDRQTPARHAAA